MLNFTDRITIIMKETYGLDTYQIIIGRLFIASKKELLIRKWNEIKMIEPYIFDKRIFDSSNLLFENLPAKHVCCRLE